MRLCLGPGCAMGGRNPLASALDLDFNRSRKSPSRSLSATIPALSFRAAILPRKKEDLITICTAFLPFRPAKRWQVGKRKAGKRRKEKEDLSHSRPTPLATFRRRKEKKTFRETSQRLFELLAVKSEYRRGEGWRGRKGRNLVLFRRQIN